MTTHRKLLALSTALLISAGCGGSDTGQSPSEMTDQQAPPAQLVIDVNIAGGNVTPTNAQLQGKVSEPIIVRVNSDAADELHVHSSPEHTFKIEPRTGQSFQFTVDVPGRVEIELHQLQRTIATVQVRP
ncbi:MAG: hypothetical protein ACRDU5_20975 [Mycobacterium sp.]